jgi:hypothetical protein
MSNMNNELALETLGAMREARRMGEGTRASLVIQWAVAKLHSYGCPRSALRSRRHRLMAPGPGDKPMN